MNLYVDVGNSRIKWKTDQMPSARVADTIDSLDAQWCTLQGEVFPLLSGCCVRGERTRLAVDELARRFFGAPLLWRASLAEACGLRSSYPDPGRLGVDRWVAMIAARARYPDQPCVVVDAGTAITVDLIDADGLHRGGIILPGARAMLDTLNRAEQLFPDTDRDLHLLAAGVNPLADNTQDAVLGGVVYAVQGGVNAVILQQARQIKAKIEALAILVTGGDSPMLKLDSLQALPVPDLVLEGLQVWMECEQ